MTIINKRIGENIRKIRISKNVTQEDVAFEAKVDYSFFNQIENGKRNVSVKTLERIAKALGVKLQDLIK